MTDIRCWRCDHRLFTSEGAGVVLIKCSRCKAINRVALDKAITIAG